MNSVELVGHYGGDKSHALSAWTSTSRELTPEKEMRIPKLLKFLAENGHHTPFEKSALHFLVRCDTASHIHLLKHRIGVSINGESARYKELQDPTNYVPPDFPDDIKHLYQHLAYESRSYYSHAVQVLEKELGRKRAKEAARYFLLYGNQLTLDVMFNFRSFTHFVNLRVEEDAQQEIQNIGGAMLHLVEATGDFDASLKAFDLL